MKNECLKETKYKEFLKFVNNSNWCQDLIKKLNDDYKQKFKLDNVFVTITNCVIVDFISDKYVREIWFDSKENFCDQVKLDVDDVDWTGVN